jgi:hypothetical protein
MYLPRYSIDENTGTGTGTAYKVHTAYNSTENISADRVREYP